MEKRSYPVSSKENVINADYPYDISKWMMSMKNMYYLVSRGMNGEAAFNEVTKNWTKMEQQDYKAWVRYYQENTHEKYKTAQYYQLGGDGEPMIPMSHLKAVLPGSPVPNMSSFDNNPTLDEAANKERIKAKIRAIISRLQSAEKLVTDPGVLAMLKNLGIDNWLENLHALKRVIQTAPMRISSSPILEDLIVRQANKLAANGFEKEGYLLAKIAQEGPVRPPTEDQLKEKQVAPEEPEIPIDTEMDEGDEAMLEFIQRMNNNYMEDDSDVNDKLMVTAQMEPLEVTAPEPEPELEQAPDLPPELEQDPDLIIDEPEEEPQQVTISDPLDNTNVTIEDIIERLETVADILRKREIPRQLSIVDLMMDRIGIVGFFPTLAEAQRSALESNQYMASRIDDVLSKLRGSVINDNKIDLTTTPAEASERDDTLEQVRQNLSNQEEKEKNKKTQRLMEKAQPKPKLNLTNELEAPVEIKQAPPQPV